MLLINVLCQLIIIAIFPHKWNLSLLSRINMISIFYCIILSYNSYYKIYIGSGLGIYGGYYQVTNITQLVDIFLSILVIILLGITGFNSFYHYDKSYSPNDFNNKNKAIVVNAVEFKQILEYPLLGNFILMGSLLLISSLNIISLYISLELQSFSLYILSSLNSSKESSKSGLKYFLLGALSSCFILLGLSLIYSYSGITSLESLYVFYKVNPSNIFLQISLLIFITGFLFKIAVVPFHNWAVDVYEGVPTIITAWLSTITKISLLIIIMDIVNYCYDSWTSLLILVSLLSIIVGSLSGLVQIRIKRLFTYSMISHVGFLLLALAICSVKSVEAFLFYLIQYSLTNLTLFIILLVMGYHLKNSDSYESPIIYVKSLKGFFKINPFLSICFTISLLSLGGIPPLIGFFAKFNVLFLLISEGYIFLSLIAIIASVISVGYYLKVIKTIYFEECELEFKKVKISAYLYLIISVLTLYIMFFILYPDVLYQNIQLVSLTYFNKS